MPDCVVCLIAFITLSYQDCELAFFDSGSALVLHSKYTKLSSSSILSFSSRKVQPSSYVCTGRKVPAVIFSSLLEYFILFFQFNFECHVSGFCQFSTFLSCGIKYKSLFLVNPTHPTSALLETYLYIC